MSVAKARSVILNDRGIITKYLKSISPGIQAFFSVSLENHHSNYVMPAPNIETIVSLSKRRGFVYPASDIYGGLGSSWDYGPLGVELANNIKKSWWNWMVYERDDIEGLDSSIIQNRLVWKYSGHEQTFHDPLVDCRTCKERFRLDKLLDVQCGNHSDVHPGENPECSLTEAQEFNLMFRTTTGDVSSDE